MNEAHTQKPARKLEDARIRKLAARGGSFYLFGTLKLIYSLKAGKQFLSPGRSIHRVLVPSKQPHPPVVEVGVYIFWQNFQLLWQESHGFTGWNVCCLRPRFGVSGIVRWFLHWRSECDRVFHYCNLVRV